MLELAEDKWNLRQLAEQLRSNRDEVDIDMPDRVLGGSPASSRAASTPATDQVSCRRPHAKCNLCLTSPQPASRAHGKSSRWQGRSSGRSPTSHSLRPEPVHRRRWRRVLLPRTRRQDDVLESLLQDFPAVRPLPFWDLTQPAWHMHLASTSTRNNESTATCDCTHFCYAPAFWSRRFFPVLARAVAPVAPALASTATVPGTNPAIAAADNRSTPKKRPHAGTVRTTR